MSRYSTAIRLHADGTWGFAIVDGRGSKVRGLRGCRTRARAIAMARDAERDLIASDRACGKRSWIELPA